ncbi:TPA: hypothetical protein ACH3X1_012079 [Trebouxia sp. C0004]
MRVSGFSGEGRTPSMGLRQGCPLSATLFGLFIDGLHHYLEPMAPAAGIQIQHMRLRELVVLVQLPLEWFRPYSLRRRHCHMPVSGGRMQRFLQFRLGCHSLPIAAGCFDGAAHVPRAHRVCQACNSGVVGDEMHLVFECTALTSLRSRYASLHRQH